MVAAETGSGHVSVSGAPIRPWTVTTASSRIDVNLENSSSVNLDASSGSGSVNVSAVSVSGTIEKGLARGTIGNGGPLLRLTSGSGAVNVTRK